MPNQDLAVTLVQSDIAWESVDQNLQRMERHLSAVNDSQLIVLPEMFTTGFSMRPEKIAETMDGKAVQWLRDTARAKRADLVGSVAIQDQGRYYNRLLWAKADGSLFSYDKKHLFSFAGEHEHYTPGDAPLIVKVDGWSVAAFVCYDLRFPVWSRNNKSQYDLALYIASWPERRAKHWQNAAAGAGDRKPGLRHRRQPRGRGRQRHPLQRRLHADRPAGRHPLPRPPAGKRVSGQAVARAVGRCARSVSFPEGCGPLSTRLTGRRQ
ncbi:hypothetical protein JOS77_25285 [Chromobacterium haemolyticum]|nr:hypothetical protein JOS77_25285 [Chromobacterium haemolyticum]